MDRRKILNHIGNFALTLALLYMAVHLGQRWLARDPRVGLTPPSFEAYDSNGQKVSLPPADGQPRVLVFWATWCGPCRVEMERLQAAVKSGDLPAANILAISSGEDAELVQKTAREHGYTYPVYSDPESTSAQGFQVRVTPTIFHLDGSGKIRWVSEGIHPMTVRYAKSHLHL